MKLANKRWGYRKIKGELRKLGISVSKTTIATILKAAGFDPHKAKYERTWINFITSHTKRYFACDFMTVDTLFLKRLYLFSIMDVATRQIMLFAVTTNPTKNWLENVIRTGLCCGDNLPHVMVSDRDGVYGNWLAPFLEEYFEMELIRTPTRCPNCNAFIERWHRSLREEVLDHCLIFGEKDLRQVVSQFVDYYHFHRPHQGLTQDSPMRKHPSSSVKVLPKINHQKMVDGIITNFELAA
ncbi:MAG: integrase core domain-containing protein [Bdellovibrionota bacterium]